jgi:hypothetical protein
MTSGTNADMVFVLRLAEILGMLGYPMIIGRFASGIRENQDNRAATTSRESRTTRIYFMRIFIRVYY